MCGVCVWGGCVCGGVCVWGGCVCGEGVCGEGVWGRVCICAWLCDPLKLIPYHIGSCVCGGRRCRND